MSWRVGSCERPSWLGFRSRNPRWERIGLVLLVGGALGGAPVWKAPSQLPLGELQTLELREADPTRPAPARPALEDRLGSLSLRALEPLADGRGWRFQVQALRPGLAVVPAMDLGGGVLSPELRLQVPRQIPFGAPWMGFGGGREDRLPDLPFPWAWASLLLLPPAVLVGAGLRRWRQGAGHRHLRHAVRTFHQHWPPADRERATLDAAHAQGRELLEARFGTEARAWGAPEFQARRLAAWDQWCRSLDAARFGLEAPPFPEAARLVEDLLPLPDGRKVAP